MPASSEKPPSRVELPKTGPGSVVPNEGRINKETADALAELAGNAAVSASKQAVVEEENTRKAIRVRLQKLDGHVNGVLNGSESIDVVPKDWKDEIQRRVDARRAEMSPSAVPAAEPAATDEVLREQIEATKQAIAARRKEYVDSIINGGSIDIIPEAERADIMRRVEERKAEMGSSAAPVAVETSPADPDQLIDFVNEPKILEDQNPPEPETPPALEPAASVVEAIPTEEKKPVWVEVVQEAKKELQGLRDSIASGEMQREIDSQVKASVHLDTEEELNPGINLDGKSAVQQELTGSEQGLAALTKWEYLLTNPQVIQEIRDIETRIKEIEGDLEGKRYNISTFDVSDSTQTEKYNLQERIKAIKAKGKRKTGRNGIGTFTPDPNQATLIQEANDEFDQATSPVRFKELQALRRDLKNLQGNVPAEALGGEKEQFDVTTQSGKITAEAIEKLRQIRETGVLVTETAEKTKAVADEITGQREGQETTDQALTRIKIIVDAAGGMTDEELNRTLQEAGFTREQWDVFVQKGVQQTETPLSGVPEGSAQAEDLDQKLIKIRGLWDLAGGMTDEELNRTLQEAGVTREDWDAFIRRGIQPVVGEGPTTAEGLSGEGADAAAAQAAAEEDRSVGAGDSERVEVDEPGEHDQAAPTAEAVDSVINKLLEKYTSEPAKERAGWIRGGLIPLLGGIAGSTGTQFLLKLTGAAARWSSPAIAAVTAFVGSVGGSAARWKFQGENALRLFARYSHTERTKSGKRQLLRLWTRGAERGALRRQLKISGPPKEFATRFDETSGNFDLNNLTPEQKMGMIESGAWYLLATKGVDQLGAYLSDADRGVITEWTPRVQKAVAEIYNGLTPDQKQTIDTELEARLGRRQGRYHKAEVAEVAAIGAAKAAVLAEVLTLIFQNFHHITDLFRGKPKPVEASGTPTGPEINPDSPLRTHGPVTPNSGTTTPGTGTPGTPPPEAGIMTPTPGIEVPKSVETPSTLLSIDKNVGHTLAEAGKPVDWTNTDQWHRLLDVNNTAAAIKQTELWSTGSQIAKAIAGDPDKYLVGLSVEDKALAFRMAKEAVAAFAKAGLDTQTGLLTNPGALDRNEIIAAFWWVIQNKKLAA